LFGSEMPESAMLERLGETGPLGVLYQNMGLLARESGEHEAAVAAFESALVLMRRADDRRGVAAVYTNLSRTYLLMGRLDDAYACGATALAMADRLGEELAAASARYHLAGICEARGDTAAARAHLRVVVDIDRRYGLPKYEENRARLAALDAAS
jgi:tetratricopeptide (TPR) repeat protein